MHPVRSPTYLEHNDWSHSTFPTWRTLRATIVCSLLATSAAIAQDTTQLRWGGDAEGGAPFVEADPRDPARVQGFDVEVAALVARALGRTSRFVQAGFTTLDAS